MKAILYVIAEHAGEYSKIGCTDDVRARVSFLQTANYKQLFVFGAWKVPDAEELEALAHKALRAHRERGEWFHLPPGHVAFLLGQLCADLGIKAEPISLGFKPRKSGKRPEPETAISPLQAWRFKEGDTLQTMTDRLGVEGLVYTTLQRIERGHRRPNREVMQALMRVTGLSAAQILEPWLRVATGDNSEAA